MANESVFLVLKKRKDIFHKVVALQDKLPSGYNPDSIRSTYRQAIKGTGCTIEQLRLILEEGLLFNWLEEESLVT